MRDESEKAKSEILHPSSLIPHPSIHLLAIGAHPDDIELSAGGILALLAQRGYRVGLLHLTRGECGTRGTPEIREKESIEAARILGAAERVGLNLGDGRLENSHANRQAVVEVLRRLRPTVVMTHMNETRHPDHIRAHELVRDCCFLSNVGGYAASGTRHKISELIFFLAHEMRGTFNPDWIVDITTVHETKLNAIRAYRTQFYIPDENSGGPQTRLSSPEFWEYLENRSRRWGHMIDAKHAEPFQFQGPLHVDHAFVKMLTTNPALPH